MVEHQQQKTYWESQKKRKHPSDPVVEAFARPKVEYIRENVDLPEAPAILDVGCGNGYFTHYLNDLGDTVGLDFANAMLRMNPGRHLVQGSATELPFQNGSFDLVFCSNLLHHLPVPTEAVAEMARVSKCYVVLSEPNRANPAMLLLGLVKPEERASLRFTRKLLLDFTNRVGLQTVASTTRGFVTPNRMPRSIVEILSRFENPNPFAAYSVVVARRP